MAAPPASGLRHLPESHRSTPLAPSQEIAYRQKCIYLKRRLQDIEKNNDGVRQRLARERHFQDKMRLNRAILLNHMKDLIENPSKQYSKEDMAKLKRSSEYNSDVHRLQGARGNGYSDTTDASSNEDIAEPEERPVRVKRARDGTPRKSAGGKSKIASTDGAMEQADSSYDNAGLPHIAFETANANGPSAFQTLDSQASARISSSSSNPTQPHVNSHFDNQQTQHDSGASNYQANNVALGHGHNRSSVGDSVPPVKPLEPFQQFSQHLKPQLEDDNIPPEGIAPKIEETWHDIGQVGQAPWQAKYDGEMQLYELQLEQYNHAEGAAVTLVNGSGAGFSAVNH